MTGPASSTSTVLLVHRDAGIPGPRVTRANWLEKALRDPDLGGDEGTRVVRWPRAGRVAPGKPVTSGRNGLRRRLGDRAARMFIDRHEPKMWMRGRSLPTEGIDAGLLVSMPASPAAVAAGRLRAAGIPYVVDQGDPWGIGTEAFRGRGLAARRRWRLEAEMWRGAAGGIFTTESQAEAVLEVVPGLPHLIRINGYRPVDQVEFVDALARRKRPDGVLRLAHFGALRIGRLANPRIEIGRALDALAESGRWTKVVFTQFGHTPEAFVRASNSPRVQIEGRERIAWERVIEVAVGFDAAVVVGNRPPHRSQVPSKVTEYLGLPIPRIALTSGVEGDELTEIARSLPGYLVVPATDPDLDGRIDEFLGGTWGLEDLVPPQEHSWDRVAVGLTDFFRTETGLPRSASDRTADTGTVRQD